MLKWENTTMVTYNNQEIKEFVDLLLQNYKFITLDDDETLLVYDDKTGTYKDGNKTLKTICANNELINTKNKFVELKLNVEGRTYISRNDFIVPEGLVNLKNGVLNINTMELIDKSSDYNFLEQIPIDYNPKAESPYFNKFISEVISKGNIKLLQKWFGYHFVHDNRFKFAMMLLGVKNSGKSLIITILENLFGISNFSHFELCEFNQAGTHAISNLYGKLGNTYSDMSMQMLKDIGKFKVLTGNDYISTRYAFKEPFSFKNYAKLTFSLNKCPLIDGCVLEDEAFWSRLGMLQFNNPFNRVIDEDLNIKIIGGTKDNKFYSGELSGILNFALEGYKEVLKNGFKDYPANQTKLMWSNSMMSQYDTNQSNEPIQTKCSRCGKSIQNFHPEICEEVVCRTCQHNDGSEYPEYL
ncbi:MAG: hypothetical protein FIB07_03060 [Candidatus Methanoperedens sp.]|nr:hypothetical protein [Candidatus Methanoperedens sp.]